MECRKSAGDIPALNAVSLTEKIVLLHLISQLPGGLSDVGTKSSPGEASKKDEKGRILSLRQENEIVSTLAFLSGISNNPNEISAVCLEELPAEGACKILVAVNKLRPGSGQAVLDKIQRGFERIFRRLSTISSASAQDREKIKQMVFNDIVALCRDRILRRLGVKAAVTTFNRKEKRFIGDALHEFLKHPWQTRSAHAGMSRQRLKNYRVLSKALLEQLYTFNALNDWKHRNMVKLVHDIARYMEEVPFKDLIENMRYHPMDRSAIDRLHDCFSKIARYKQSASFLCRKAKKIPMIRRLTVDQVRLDPVVFRQTIHDLGPSTMNAVSRTIPYRKGTLQINNLPSWVQLGQGQFSRNVSMALRESKIHAEVQILAHYETVSPEVVPPRVINSSKDACYLCHALIGLHGRYVMPKSHGRIYTGWRLPATHHMEALGQKLHDHLIQVILNNVVKCARDKEKPRQPYPNESTVFTLNISASTLLSCLDLPSQIRHDETTGQSFSNISGSGKDVEVGPDQSDQHLDHQPSRSTLHGSNCGIVAMADLVSPMPSGSETVEKEAHDETCGDTNTSKKQSETKSPITASLELPLRTVPNSGTHSVKSTVTLAQLRDSPLPGPIQFENGRFCFEDKEVFTEGSFSNTKFRLMSSAESAEILRDNPGKVIDVLSLPTGAETSYLHKVSGNISYFAFGERVIMIETTNI